MRIKTILFAFISTAILSTITFAANHAQALVKENLNPQDSADYWTPERMQNAKEMPMPKVDPQAVKEIPTQNLHLGDQDDGDGAPPDKDVVPDTHLLYTPIKDVNTPVSSYDKGTLNEHFSSSRLVPITADLTYPYRAVGKLFFTIPGQGDFVCSASVLRPRIILTAGHCVHSGSGGAAGFYTNWLFVPAFRDGVAPLQSWKWRYAIVTNTWATGGGAVPNAADYAMIESEDRPFNGVLQKLGSITGYFGYQTVSLVPNHAHLLGYPCNLDKCQKMHQVTAESARAVENNNAEYGSDMGGGSSGGPWVQNFGALADGQTGGLNPGLNRIIGVTSWGYISADPKAQGSAIPDSRFTSILNTICAHRAGNC